jgi:peroxiredoxin Q/BCP
MKTWIPFVAATSLFTLFSATAVSALEMGDAAPDFSLQGSDGKTHRLRDYIGGKGTGKRGVVIAWFPKAFTPG